MKRLSIVGMFFFLCSGLLFGQESAQHEQDSLQYAIVVMLNDVRNNPASFIPAIDRYRLHVRSFTKNVPALETAVKEIKARLRKERPLPVLNMQGALQFAAMDHATDITTSGVMGHIGSDSSDPLIRVNRYGLISSLGEAITYGNNTPELIIAAFLVDEGTPGRGHRENLLNPIYSLVGVAVGSHAVFGRTCVIVLGAP
ncbi:MAG: CAP domain-containing protein [Candidatus Kapabacteria bacterium]|nr:CAP domain-containing protein [Candidatus Kapabacteria bacterium]